MSIAGLIPVVVTGGVVMKFSDHMLGKSRKVTKRAKRNVSRVNKKVNRRKGRVSATRRSTYPNSRYSPI